MRIDSSRSRWLLLVPLALLHLGLAFWLNGRHAAPPAKSRLTVLRLDLARAVPPRPRPAMPVEPRLPLPVVLPIEPPRVDGFNPQTQPAAPAQSAESTRPAPLAPLNLALPVPPQAPASAPKVDRNPALTDPRANTRRANFATRMADTLGTDPTLREESLGPGKHRFKQGSTCVETAESRIGQIDPFSATMRGSPQLVTSCK
jgi:hypothetical protein